MLMESASAAVNDGVAEGADQERISTCCTTDGAGVDDLCTRDRVSTSSEIER